MSTSKKITPSAKPTKTEKPAPEKKEKKVRLDFNVEAALDINGHGIPLDDNGKLTASPANWDRTFKPLKKEAFASEGIYVTHRADLLELRIAKAQDTLKALRAEALRIEKFGDTETRKRVKKLQRARTAYQKLFESLKSEIGEDVDLDELLGGDGELDGDLGEE
jgi:hypothetical protein